VKAQLIGDFPQDQRAHRHSAMGEKGPLPVDDRLSDAFDGFEPLLDILDQPACFLQLRSHAVGCR
jgi:hypothetical protein